VSWAHHHARCPVVNWDGHRAPLASIAQRAVPDTAKPSPRTIRWLTTLLARQLADDTAVAPVS